MHRKYAIYTTTCPLSPQMLRLDKGEYLVPMKDYHFDTGSIGVDRSLVILFGLSNYGI